MLAERANADDLRAAGWTVAVHNDYWQHGELYTFWLLTHPSGRWLKGEGLSDAEALNQIRAVLNAEKTLATELVLAYGDEESKKALRDIPTLAETTTDYVTSCESCPFSYPMWRRAHFTCAHENAPGDDCDAPERVLGPVSERLSGPPPSWCPLRCAPTLVMLQIPEAA
jgi:hypothetical protein